MRHLLQRWPIFFLALAPVLPLWRAIFLGEAIGPWDHIRSMAPWNGPAPTTPWDVLQADGVLQFAPWRSLVFDAWGHGHLPLWNPYQLMGTPLLANSQSAGFYPPHILIGLLHVPLYPAMTFLAWMHLFWAGLGVYLLVRRMGGTKTGGAVAGASFSLSAFMVSWTALASVISTVAWIPWVLACILGVFQTDLLWGVAEQRSFRPTTMTPREVASLAMNSMKSQAGWRVGLACSVAMMVLAGHLQFVAFGLLAAFVIILALGARLINLKANRILRIQVDRASGNEIEHKEYTHGAFIALPFLLSVVKACLPVLLGLLIAAPQLLPVLAFSRESHRRAPPTAEGYLSYTSSAIQPYEWVSLEFPKLLGDPSEFAAGSNGPSAFWPQFVKRGAAFPESALAIGPLVLFLLCCLRRPQWRRALPLVCVGVLGLLIACGTPFDYLLYYGVPGWSSTGSPGRAIVLFVLAACCLAGLSIEPKRKESKQYKFLPAAVFGILTILSLLISSRLGGGSDTGSVFDLRVSPLAPEALYVALPIIVVLLALGFVVGAVWIWRREMGKPMLLAYCLAAPMLLVWGVLRTGEPIPVGRPTSMDRYAYVNSHWNLYTTPQAFMPPNMASLLRIHDVAGYDSLLDKDTKAMLDQANRQDSSPPENGNMMFVKPTADQAALQGLGVSDAEFLWKGDPIETATGGRRTEMLLGTPKITEEDAQGLTVACFGPQLIVLDRNLPGWSATVDGARTPLQQSEFLAVNLPNGQHTVRFSYWPPGLTAGLVFFAIGMLAVVPQLLFWRRKFPLG